MNTQIIDKEVYVIFKHIKRCTFVRRDPKTNNMMKYHLLSSFVKDQILSECITCFLAR